MISGIDHIDVDDYMVYRFLSNCGATVEQRLDDIYPWLAKFLFDQALTDEQIRDAGLLVEAEINHRERELIRVRATTQEERRVLGGYRAIQARNVLAHAQGMPPLNMANLEFFVAFAVTAFLHHERRTVVAARVAMYQRFLDRVDTGNQAGYLGEEMTILNNITTEYSVEWLVDAAYDVHKIQFFWAADRKILVYIQRAIPEGTDQLTPQQEDYFCQRLETEALHAYQLLTALHPDL